MAKSTIILADTDEKFLTPLELKFVEELDEDADIEIITDSSYFNEYFLSPKSANVLVVSEDLYTSDLQKHNINKIFVLTENIDEGGTEDLGVTKIFKYTSPKEIYKEVISLGLIDSNTATEKETVIALVYSASGSDIVLTMVDGRVLYRDGEYMTIDIEKTMFEVQKETDAILHAL